MTSEKRKTHLALKEAVEAIYFGDNDDYERYLWKIVRILGGDEAVVLLEEDGATAYLKYCAKEKIE